LKQERVIEGLENVLTPVNLSFVEIKPQHLNVEYQKVVIITGLGKSLSQAMWAKSF